VFSSRMLKLSLAIFVRIFPSKENGIVTIPIDNASYARAMIAEMGAAPDPVPPPKLVLCQT